MIWNKNKVLRYPKCQKKTLEIFYMLSYMITNQSSSDWFMISDNDIAAFILSQTHLLFSPHPHIIPKPCREFLMNHIRSIQRRNPRNPCVKLVKEERFPRTLLEDPFGSKAGIFIVVYRIFLWFFPTLRLDVNELFYERLFWYNGEKQIKILSKETRDIWFTYVSYVSCR